MVIIMAKKYFYKGAIKKDNAKAMWEFLSQHEWYYTMNSWNGLITIANNVKIHNLQLEGDSWFALELLREENYETINSMIYSWEKSHPNYKVYFNGRSGGYLILKNKTDNCNILPSWITENDNYEEFKQTCKDYYNSIKEAIPSLIEYVELVQDFDKLCDEMRDYVNDLSLTNKDDLLQEEAENFIDEFNTEFEGDLKAWNFKPLELKDKTVDVSDIYKSASLSNCLERMLLKYTYGESFVSYTQEKNGDNYTITFKRA